MYYFSIPDSGATSIYNTLLLEAMRQHRDWFYDDFVIETVYGCPHFCIWNGNRGSADPPFRPSFWRSRVENYVSYGIRYRLTFTNFLLQPVDLYDAYANKIAETLNSIGGYVMVSIPLMAKYMKKYPALEVCWSTSTDFGKTEEERVASINRLSGNTLVVLPYEYNNKPDLQKFTHPENLEIIVNEKCVENCPWRRQHWCNVNEVNLFRKDVEYTKCMVKDKKLLKDVYAHNVNRKQLANYAALGINHFKVVGRTSPFQAEKAYLEYFVLPERRESLLEFFLNIMRHNLDEDTFVVK